VFAKAVAADPVLAEHFKVAVHGNAELGDELSMLKDCVAGTLDLMLCSGAPAGNVVPQIGLINTPFLFQDYQHARAALDGAVGARLAEIARGKNLLILAWGENGMRQITSNKPVRTPDDLRGLKLRVPQSEVMLGGMKALGADAAPLSFTQLKEALRTGQFEAEENAIVLIDTGKFYEVQKCVSLTNHIYDPAMIAISPDLMDDLTEPQRVAMARCAQLGMAMTRKVVDTADREGLAHLKSVGMTVVEDVDTASFRAAAQPFIQNLGAKYGADLVNQIREAGG
jgi:tripartite ATP-independent transporter DctP family solute receptor